MATDGRQFASKMLENLCKIGTKQYKDIPATDVELLLGYCKDIFTEQPMCLAVRAPVKICGDIHGQFADLVRIFDKEGFPPTSNYVFLGDYVDRGPHSIETILFLFALKVLFPDRMMLLRGNHETSMVNAIYGFQNDVNKRYNVTLSKHFNDVFGVMPLSAIVEGTILCMHGGLSKVMLDSRKDLYTTLAEIPRPFVNPANGTIEADLLWADPHAAVSGFRCSIRGVSNIFGKDTVSKVCDKYNLSLIVRAHQVVQSGYEFFCDRKLVTVFSAPHYCGQFDNSAAVLDVSEDLKVTFRVFTPSKGQDHA